MTPSGGLHKRLLVPSDVAARHPTSRASGSGWSTSIARLKGSCLPSPPNVALQRRLTSCRSAPPSPSATAGKRERRSQPSRTRSTPPRRSSAAAAVRRMRRVPRAEPHGTAPRRARCFHTKQPGRTPRTSRDSRPRMLSEPEARKRIGPPNVLRLNRTATRPALCHQAFNGVGFRRVSGCPWLGPRE